MSKLLEKHLAKLASRLEPRPLQQDITKILAQNVQRLDPKTRQLRAQYSAHFDDLFSGLTTIQSTSGRAQPLNLADISRKPAEESLEMFKTAYYLGTLTPKIASAALANPRLKVYEIASMFRLVEEGGTLIKWSQGERLFFELQSASVLWKLKYQQLAKNIITDSFQEHRSWILKSIDRMPQQRVRNLVQALRATSPTLARELLQKTSTMRPLWIMWSEFRGDLREQVLARMQGVINYEIIDLLVANSTNRDLLVAAPATETQAMDLLYKLELIQQPQHPQELFSISQR